MQMCKRRNARSQRCRLQSARWDRPRSVCCIPARSPHYAWRQNCARVETHRHLMWAAPRTHWEERGEWRVVRGTRSKDTRLPVSRVPHRTFVKAFLSSVLIENKSREKHRNASHGIVVLTVHPHCPAQQSRADTRHGPQQHGCARPPQKPPCSPPARHHSACPRSWRLIALSLSQNIHTAPIRVFLEG